MCPLLVFFVSLRLTVSKVTRVESHNMLTYKKVEGTPRNILRCLLLAEPDSLNIGTRHTPLWPSLAAVKVRSGLLTTTWGGVRWTKPVVEQVSRGVCHTDPAYYKEKESKARNALQRREEICPLVQSYQTGSGSLIHKYFNPICPRKDTLPQQLFLSGSFFCIDFRIV